MYDPTDVGNLISGSSVFCKSSLYIWKLPVHRLLKLSMGDSEHYLASMWDKFNCAVVGIFFGIGMKSSPFPILCPLLNFPNLLPYLSSIFTALSFRIWNSSAGIPSPPLALWCFLRSTWLHSSGCLALGEWSHHHGYSEVWIVGKFMGQQYVVLGC